MKKAIKSLLPIMLFLLTAATANAGYQAVIEVEVTENGHTEKYSEILTFDDNRFRIDFVGEDKKVTDETPYIMTTDNGHTWVMGDKPKDKFYCSKVQTEEFFRNLGGQVTRAVDFFNVKAQSPSVRETLREPGPEILGFKTTHVRLETDATAYAWFLFFKFEYAVKMVDDIWYTTDVEIHPIRRKWLNALTQSGNDIIDNLFTQVTEKLPGPVLKSESSMDIINVRKKSTKTQTERTIVTSLEELEKAELDKIFVMPSCIEMDDDEIQEKGKALLGARKLML
jgi:hypothetical protein